MLFSKAKKESRGAVVATTPLLPTREEEVAVASAGAVTERLRRPDVLPFRFEVPPMRDI